MSDTVVSKRCFKCKEIKPISEFHKRQDSKDGHRNTCKSCRLKIHKEYRQTEQGKIVHRRGNKKYQKTEKGKAAQKRYNQTEKGKASRQKKENRFLNRHPNQIKAKSAVNHAIASGKLPPPDTLLCHYCPEPAQQYHHHKGYAPKYWLDVVPVCTKCHYLQRS